MFKPAASTAAAGAILDHTPTSIRVTNNTPPDTGIGPNVFGNPGCTVGLFAVAGSIDIFKVYRLPPTLSLTLSLACAVVPPFFFWTAGNWPCSATRQEGLRCRVLESGASGHVEVSSAHGGGGGNAGPGIAVDACGVEDWLTVVAT